MADKLRLMLTGGGTGGHVYPAIAIAEALRRDEPAPAFFYIGSSSGIEATLAPQAGFDFAGVAVGAIRGRAPWQIAASLARLVIGIGQAWQIIGRFRPQAIFATGGYICAPVVLAGWLRRVPILLYLPDIEPGLAVRFMTPFATRVAVSFPEAERYFPPKKVLLSGYPVRPQFLGRDKAGARQRLGLAEGKVLLVLGGSRGAHRLNAAIVSAIGPLLDITQVVHIGGRDDEAWLNRERNKLPEVQRGRYRVYGYVHEEIGDLLAAADLVLARAGASTLGEFPAAGLPSLLVPYPYAGAHQARNADYLASRGAARVLAEDELDVMLLPTLQSLLGDEAALAAMAEGSRKLARPDAADRLADELRRMARGGRR